jgi:hypothetical protein
MKTDGEVPRTRSGRGRVVTERLIAALLAVGALGACGGGSGGSARDRRDVPCEGPACVDAAAPDDVPLPPDGAPADVPGGSDGSPGSSVACAFVEPAEGALVSGVVTVRGTCRHPAGVVAVRILAGGAELARLEGAAPDAVYEAQLDTTAYPDGALSLTIAGRAADDARGATTRSVVVDNTGPTVTLHEPAAGGRHIGSVRVAATAEDANGAARLLVALDGGLLATVDPYEGGRVETTVDLGSITTGVWRLAVVAEDVAGNRGEASVEIRIVSVPRFRGEPPRPIGTPRGVATELTVGDGDGDGTPDLWFAGSTHVMLHRGQGDGRFAPGVPVVEASTRLVRAADLDGDGRAELLLSEQTATGPQLAVVGWSAAAGGWTVLERHPLAQRGTALALGDVDGDGRRDLLVGADVDEYSLGVLLATPAGPPFFTDPIYSGGVTNVRRIDTADFDGDGHLDAVVGREDELFSVFPGAGDGTFGIARNLRLGDRAKGVAVADLREDGVPDLLVTDWAGALHVFLGEPDDEDPWQFGDDERPYGPLRLPVGSHEVLAADLDGDGHEDAVVIDETSKNAAVFLGDGQGGLRLDLLYNLGPFPGRAHLADLDGDGRLDLVVLNRNVDTYTVAMGRAAGRFAAPIELLVAFAETPEPVDLVVADFDGTAAGGHAHPELVVVGDTVGGARDKTFPVWLFRSDGRYPVMPGVPTALDASAADDGSYAELGRPRDARTADLDADGAPDLAIVFDTRALATAETHQVGLLLGDHRGGFPTWQRLPLASRPRTIALCDVTGDDRPDVLVGTPSTAVDPATLVAAEVQTGAPLQLAQLGLSVLTGDAADVQCARVDGDAANDFLTVNTTDGDLNYLRGTASVPVTQGERQALAIGEGPRRLAVADVDGDGALDATATVEDNLALAFAAPGGRTFDTALFLSHPGRGPHGVAVRDFTDDGFPDIAVANSSDGTLSVYVNAGDRTFLGPVDFHTSRKPTELVSADLNGDGCADLAVLNATGRTVTILMAEGARCRPEDR